MRTNPVTRRGFALPLVVLASVAVGLFVSVLVSRQSVQSLGVQRQIEAYQNHHAGRGIQQAVSAWLRTQSGGEVLDNVGDDGHALDMILPDGSILAIFIEDGQGLPLFDLSGLNDEDTADGQAILDAYLASLGTDAVEDWTRVFGPLAVSANAADARTMRAVAGTIVEPALVDRFVKNVLEARADRGLLSRQAVTQAAISADIDTEPRNRLNELLTTTPSLWVVTAELRNRENGPVLARYSGLAELRIRGQGASGGVAMSQGAMFFSWNEASVDDVE